MSNDFSSKVDELQADIDRLGKDVTKKDRTIPPQYLFAAVIPILSWVLLYFLQPSFVMNKEGDEPVRSNSKVLSWTALISVLLWSGMYFYLSRKSCPMPKAE